MKYFYDCEFFEDGVTIDLISIGIVSEDGKREYYAVNADIVHNYDLWYRIYQNKWLMDNVIPQIMPIEEFRRPETMKECLTPKEQIRAEIEEFLGYAGPKGLPGYARPKLWGWYSTYDHMILNQLFGRMMDKPEWFPWVTHDIASIAQIFGMEGILLATPEKEHHALSDAYWHRDLYFELKRRLKSVYKIVLP